MRVRSITDDIDEHWGWIEPELMKCQPFSVEPLDVVSLREDIRARKAMIIALEDDTGLLTVVLVEFNLNSLHVRLCSGKNLDKWASALNDRLTELAQVMNVKYITQLGRKGWARQMKQHGWDHQLSQYVRTV